jgi:Bacterial SH3 domain
VPIPPELVAQRVATVAAESTATAAAQNEANSLAATGTSVPTSPPATPTLPATAAVTNTVSATATASPPATPPLTVAVAVTVTATATATVASTPAPTATATPTTLPTATATQTLVPAPTVTVSPTVATPATIPAAATPVAAITVTASITATVAASAPMTATSAAPATVVTQTLATPAAVATVMAGKQAINVRGGPGVQFGIVGTLPAGQALGVIGTDAKRAWWQVCCVSGRPGWVSDGVVTFEGQRQAVPITPPLMPDQLQASWALHWQCYGQNCTQPECVGQSTAQTGKVLDERWLEVKREATWPDKCGQPENWLSQVDRYTGQEPQSTGGPLFYIWMGANPGPESRSIDLLGRKLSLWCTGTRTREVDGGQGWTFAYEGEACYDRASGVVVTLQYTKRWLFTGNYQGKTYNKEYLGSYEVYQQILTDTNAPLSGK